MKYIGGKTRHAKELLPIILKNRKPWQFYVEPFVGGFNMIDKVDGLRIANDNHYYLIELFRAIQYWWEPPENLSCDEYYELKNNKEKYMPRLVGFAGFGCSFAAKWFGGYARGNKKNGMARNYCLENRNALIAQSEKIQGIEIHNLNYWDLNIPPKSLIYCDPPYANTQKYLTTFNTKFFWEWCTQMVNDGHTVFVSEYTAPDNWECIWNKHVYNTLDLNTGAKKGVEKLFTLKKEK